ncbi:MULTISPECIES: CynX/NimT family MFS transporter [Paenarthrobacter]|uniref:MFS transporter n=1 Tax=Paenarthrobacter ureafaciens TaxID=37931 RepID=A0AAX3EK00_PAEUR|nr:MULTISPECIES: MFS transporter [Paenarthrobacter]NKR12350.1 MFS transporter [Arthrobacter sp. M5]NKR14181.1 MFS transporter [Arthrobacter sp. M6]OEH61370.1 MFS transporter [Arthrobacter sp. D2]OEH64199.1 MFS transporter [Arthrobacter sp. D4]MDO5863281.1 MFS transporter [Paenarthrobacter sp. SD-2]
MNQLLAKVPRGWLILACIGLIALNMRGPFVAVAPVVDSLRVDLGFSPVELGLLTGIPVLCFSLASPLASLAGRQFGAEFAVMLTLLGVLAGVVVRSSGGGVPVMVGTVLIGVAITIGNIAVPLIIRRDFAPRRQATAMGVYTAALNIGSFLTSVITAPLADLLGWRLSLAASALLALAAIVFWIPTVGVRRALVPAPVPAAPPSGSGRVAGVRWLIAGLTVGFAGQAFSYYGVTAWLPSFLSDELGMGTAEAGAGSSLFQIFAIVGGLGVPLLARFTSTTTVAVTLSALWLSVPVGLLLAPQLWWLWSSMGGVAQGGGITVIFIAVIRFARDQASAGKMSAVVQGVGYCFAALAPTIVGYVHDVSAGWTAPLLVILGSVLAFCVCTTLSVRWVARQP